MPGDNTQFRRIEADEVPLYWPVIKDLVQAALDEVPSYLKLNDIKEFLLTNQQQLWFMDIPQAIIITRILEMPLAKICYFTLCSGTDLGTILNGTLPIREWAKSLGCTKRVVGGRKGWIKPLESMGYKLTSVTLEAEI